MKLIIILLIICNATILPCYASDKQWSEKLFSYVNKKYGDEAEKRMRYLNKLVIQNQDKTDLEKLTLTNNTFNLFPWIADKNKWKKEDYWETPLELVTTFGGDCEDMVFGKWMMLRHLGISKDKLLFAYVIIKQTNQAHMILLYRDNPDVPLGKSKIYVLDNMDGEVKLAKDRKDLKGVYIFDSSGAIYGVQDDGVKREVTNIIKPGHFKNYDDLKARILQGRKELKENDGEDYLLPDL